MYAQIMTTVFPNNKKETHEQTIQFVEDSGVENEVINLYPQATFQTFDGFGGAFTDSSGYLYSLMSAKNKDKLLQAYFGIEGAGYTLGRVHLDSCDFSLSHYEAMSDSNDVQMTSFCIDRTKQYIIPFLQDAQKVAGKNLDIMVSPWSPPSFMKTNKQRNGGGELKPEYRMFWAQYLCHYIVELRATNCNVQYITTQNEPKAVQTWDSCIYSARQEKEFIRDFLYPTMRENGLDDVGICIWDHNKERIYERSTEIIDWQTDHMIKGVAFHWYSGDHFEALQLTHQTYPNKKLMQTESCVEYSKFSKDDYLGNAQKYAHDIIGDLNAGMTGFYDWNLVLDEIGGPNHVGNYCGAPFIYNTTTGELHEQNSFAYIAHFSKFISPGAVRFALSSYTDKLQCTAFKNLNGQLVVVILNIYEKSFHVNLRLNGQLGSFTVEPNSISTCLI